MGDGSKAVEEILKCVKKAIKNKNCELLVYGTRRKNLESLAKIGLTIEDAYDEMKELTYKNYVSGPVTDRDYPASDQLWIFNKKIAEEMFYIKFKIVRLNDNQLKVISFHIDEA